MTTVTTTYSKEDVFRILVDEILSNRLPGGAALTERSLVSRFGLSRTPIREVLLRLQNEYLIDFYPNQGAFVRKLTPKDVRDLFQLREALEPMAAALAANHRPEEELAELESEFAHLSSTADAALLTRLGQSLHDAIARWSDNAMLLEFYGMLRKQTMLVRSMTRSHQDVEAISLREHRSILEAIREADSSAAKERMEAHLRRTNAVVMRLILER